MKENDYELVYMAQTNNEDAISYLYEKYTPLITKKATKTYNLLKDKGIEFLDVKQECLLAFKDAINNFKESDNVLFYTFANVCIDRRLKAMITKNKRDKYRILNEAVSLEIINEAGDNFNLLDTYVEPTTDPEYNLILEEEKNELQTLIKNKLTSLEELIFDLKMQGFTYKEIENIVGKDSKDVYNAVQRIKTKINKILEER